VTPGKVEMVVKRADGSIIETYALDKSSS